MRHFSYLEMRIKKKRVIGFSDVVISHIKATFLKDKIIVYSILHK